VTLRFITHSFFRRWQRLSYNIGGLHPIQIVAVVEVAWRRQKAGLKDLQKT
jgi:hypothetical protein